MQNQVYTTSVRASCAIALRPATANVRTTLDLNIRSTSIVDTSYLYFGLVLGCIDADLCK